MAKTLGGTRAKAKAAAAKTLALQRAREAKLDIHLDILLDILLRRASTQMMKDQPERHLAVVMIQMRKS